MRDNSKDLTLERNYIQKWRFLIHEYQLVKAGKHPRFRFARTSTPSTALAVRPSPSTTTGSSSPPPTTPSSPVSGVPGGSPAAPCPTLSRRSSTSALTVPTVTRSMPYSNPSLNTTLLSPPPSTPSPDATVSIGSQSRCSNRSARSSRPGQGSWATWTATTSAGSTIVGTKHRYYLVGLIDAYTRLAWAEVVGDIKSLSVMFAVLKSINFLNAEYGIQFEAILTDNGPEMASPRNTEGHPMERMLNELGIKHRYTRPYRPQTKCREDRAVLENLERGPAGGDNLRIGLGTEGRASAIPDLLQYSETPPGNGRKDPFANP